MIRAVKSVTLVIAVGSVRPVDWLESSGLAGYFIHPISDAEDILPDHDQLVPAEAA